MDIYEKAGINEKRLANIDAFLQSIVEKKEGAGCAGLLWRRGVTCYKKAFGLADIAGKVPLKTDAIYRIFSMTKTFTVVAALTLYEKGLFRLDDPLYEFLPFYKEQFVADEDGSALRPAKRPITLRHLFTMTSGIPYPGEDTRAARALQDIWNNLKKKEKTRGAPLTTAEIVEAAAGAPLVAEPGEKWHYGFSHDVLGHVVEVITGKPLSDYMTETILKPIDLSDTAFFVPKEKAARAAKAYMVGSASVSEAKLYECAEFFPDAASYREPPAYQSGGAGLASTLDDISRYAQMLLGGGALLVNGEHRRILSRKTVDLLRATHVSPALVSAHIEHVHGYAYGLGVRTMVDPAAAGLNSSVGEWAWDGMLGTWYCIDPAEDLVAVFMIQRLPGANENYPRRFAQVVYGTLDD